MKRMMTAPRFEPVARGPLSKVHAAFTQVETFDWSGLREAARDADPRDCERTRRSFILRALDEQRSLDAFAELLRELCLAGAPIDVIGAMTRIVRDEALHVDLCDRTVKIFGGWGKDSPEPNWVRSNKNMPLRQRILSTILGSLCLGETVSVAMIQGVRRNTSEKVSHAVLTRMLADESYHSRFGWWWLEAIGMTDEDQRFAKAYVQRVLPKVVQSMRPRVEDLGRPHRVSPFGSMSMRERDAAFVRAMDKTIVPGFERYDLGAKLIWEDLKVQRENKDGQTSNLSVGVQS